MDKSYAVCKECITQHYWHHMDDQKAFFKVMIGGFRNGIAIPKKFATNIRAQISEEVKLEVPTGETYNVKVAKEQNDLVIGSGWETFASAYDLNQGDLLVFNYSRHSHFKVQIFDPSGCEKGLSCVPINSIRCVQQRIVSHGNQAQPPTGKRLAELRIGTPSDRRKTSKANPTESPLQKTRYTLSAKSPRLVVSEPGYIAPQLTPLSDQLKNEVRKKIRAIQPEIPVHLTVMQTSNVMGAILHFCSEYATQYLPDVSQPMRLKLPSKDKTWEVVLRVCNRRRIVCRGWKRFVDDNELKLGDICLFQKMKDMRLTMTVHIIRGFERS
ncbi:hypothetical protein ACP4OV_022873 [Aristida adscensionis]